MNERAKNLIKKLVYTDKQVKQLKKVNKKAIKNFFNTNYDLIVEIAQSWSSNKYLDLIAQFYVDIPNFNFENSETLIKSIKKCFKMVDCGGISGSWSELHNITYNNYSLDKKLSDNKNDFSHYFGYEYNYIAKLNEAETIKQEEEKDKQILEFLKNTFGKNTKQFKKMYLKIFTNLKIRG